MNMHAHADRLAKHFFPLTWGCRHAAPIFVVISLLGLFGCRAPSGADHPNAPNQTQTKQASHRAVGRWQLDFEKFVADIKATGKDVHPMAFAIAVVLTIDIADGGRAMIDDGITTQEAGWTRNDSDTVTIVSHDGTKSKLRVQESGDRGVLVSSASTEDSGDKSGGDLTPIKRVPLGPAVELKSLVGEWVVDLDASTQAYVDRLKEMGAGNGPGSDEQEVRELARAGVAEKHQITIAPGLDGKGFTLTNSSRDSTVRRPPLNCETWLDSVIVRIPATEERPKGSFYLLRKVGDTLQRYRDDTSVVFRKK